MQPGGSRLAEHDRCSRGGVRVDARSRGDACRPPHLCRRAARAGIENVVRDAARRPPPADRRARGGKPAGGDRHRLTVCDGGRAVVVGDEDRPAAGGRRPRDGDVAAEFTRTEEPVARQAVAAARSAASAFAVAPRSISTPAGTRTREAFRSSSTRRQPAAGTSSIRAGSRRETTTRKSASQPSARIDAPTVGSTAPSVACAACSAAAIASRRSGLTAVQRPPRQPSRTISESSRKRLQARSIAASSRSRTSIASASASGSTIVISAVVPSAGKLAVAGFMFPVHRRHMSRA